MTAATMEQDGREPQQRRSRATRRRILAATNHLLKSRAFESFSVQEIAAMAGCSIGAFYGRFRGKEDLLEPMLDRHYRAIGRWIRRAVNNRRWRALSLEPRMTWVVRMNIRVLRSRRWLIRPLTVYLRQGDVCLTEDQHRLRASITVQVRDLLMDCAGEVSHADPSDAIDFALFLVSTLCRERVLFGELSERGWIGHGDEELEKQISRAACAYLTCVRSGGADDAQSAGRGH